MNRYRKFLLPGALLLLALLIWLGLMNQFRLDDSFITYRYARNLARGWGLVYNQGESVLSTTAPLYAMLLAGLSFVIPDFHVLGGLVGAVCIGLGGGFIVALIPRQWPFAIRAWAGLVYVLSTPLWLALGMETPLWLMLVLAAVWLAQNNRWPGAGLLIGLAVLVRPDAALPGALLGVGALAAAFTRNPNPQPPPHTWRGGEKRHSAAAVAYRWQPVIGYGLPLLLPLALFAVWAWATYGSPLPVTLGAKGAQAVLGITGFAPFTTAWGGLRLIVESLVSQSPFYLVLLLMVAGLLSAPPSSITLIVLWGGLHLLAYVILGVAPYRWYYAPLVPGVILLTACGLNRLTTKSLFSVSSVPRRFKSGVTVLALLPLAAEITSFVQIADTFSHGSAPQTMLPVVDWDAYRQVGDWLHDHTPPDATVGVAEVGQVGFYADRWMTDYLGLLQPDVAAALGRGDLYSWLPEYSPDYLIFQRFRGAPLVLYNYRIDSDPWFNASYHEVTRFDDLRYAYGPVSVFERTTPRRDTQAQPVQADFGPLRLVGMATDGLNLTADGGPVRVRLDWQVIGALPSGLHIAVAGLNVPGSPTFDHPYPTDNWRGSFSTWHTLVLPDHLSPGGYPLLVTVGPVSEAAASADYAASAVGWLDVSFPQAAIPASGQSITFGRGNKPQLRLLGSQLALEDHRLRLQLQWRAERDISADYAYFVHVTPPGGGEPLAQADGQPANYPTHLWQQGEGVPLDIVVDHLPQTPGQYDVYAGWYLAGTGPESGERLKLSDAQDKVRLAEIVVTEEGGVIMARILR